MKPTGLFDAALEKRIVHENAKRKADLEAQQAKAQADADAVGCRVRHRSHV
jgi:hypothetical protein